MADSSLLNDLMHAIETRARVAAEMLRRLNVVACGVGYKITGSERTLVPSVMVSVTQKQPVEALSADDLVPKQVNGVPTDVVQTGPIVAHALNRQGRLRPIRPGISIGHERGTAGTLGAYVRRDGEILLLSNNHVLALLNEASIGDVILQPGPSDGGSGVDRIGLLAEYIPMQFLDIVPEGQAAAQAETEPKGCLPLGSIFGRVPAPALPPVRLPVEPQHNEVDAALVRPDDTLAMDPRIVDIGGAPLGIAMPGLGTRVIKSGRTTGLTHATVIQIDVTVDVRYGEKAARFSNQIMTTPLSEPGDSGSLVLDYERNAVGLLFSGSSVVTVVNPIQAVLKAFKAELITENTI